jgi:hypothetical protein
MDYATTHIIGATENMPSSKLYLARYPDKGVALVIGDRTGEDYLVATVSLSDAPKTANHLWLKGWSENRGVPEVLEAAGLVKRTGRKWATGFVYAEEVEVLPPLAADIEKFSSNE